MGALTYLALSLALAWLSHRVERMPLEPYRERPLCAQCRMRESV